MRAIDTLGQRMLKTSRLAGAALAVLLTLVGCATAPVGPAQAPSLYQRLGGNEAITAVVRDAIGNISADPRINQRFSNAGAAELTKNLVDLICERTGGPCTYRGMDMASAHEGMNIRDDEFDALVEDLAKSFATFKVPAREQGELLAMLARMKNAIVGH